MEVFKKITMYDVFRLAQLTERIRGLALDIYDVDMRGSDAGEVYNNIENVTNYMDEILREIVGRE